LVTTRPCDICGFNRALYPGSRETFLDVVVVRVGGPDLVDGLDNIPRSSSLPFPFLKNNNPQLYRARTSLKKSSSRVKMIIPLSAAYHARREPGAVCANWSSANSVVAHGSESSASMSLGSVFLSDRS
jgi:hypothetical protein